ncbi:MAG: flavin reductase family protein [Sulfolobales archaeon]
MPHPLAIILAGDPGQPGKRGGMTAAWLSRISFNPPLIVVSLSPERHTYELIKRYHYFTINLVSTALEDIALNVFGVYCGRNVDKFELSGLKPACGRSVLAPVILNSPLVIECKFIQEFIVGDHVLIVGEVVDAYKGSTDTPLVYYRDEAVSIAAP